MSKNKAKIHLEAFTIYQEVKRMIQTKYKLDIIKVDDVIDNDDIFTADILSVVLGHLAEVPDEALDEFITEIQKGLSNLFYNIAHIVERTQEPDCPDIDVQAHVDDQIVVIKAFAYDKSHIFITILTESKDIYVKYYDKIYAPTKVQKCDDLEITLLSFDTEIFKSVHHFDDHAVEGTTEKQGKMEMFEDKIVMYNGLNGVEFQRLIGCLIAGKPLLPEIESEKCVFKDFLGTTYVRDAVKVTKVNIEGKYKLGDIVLPDGTIRRKE